MTSFEYTEVMSEESWGEKFRRLFRGQKTAPPQAVPMTTEEQVVHAFNMAHPEENAKPITSTRPRPPQAIPLDKELRAEYTRREALAVIGGAIAGTAVGAVAIAKGPEVVTEASKKASQVLDKAGRFLGELEKRDYGVREKVVAPNREDARKQNQLDALRGSKQPSLPPDKPDQKP